MNKEFFNPDNFKKWMETQSNFEHKITKQYPIGEQVESKVNLKKFLQVMTLENGQENKVVKDFIKNGGKIAEVNDDEYLVEVVMGSFYINKKYVIFN